MRLSIVSGSEQDTFLMGEILGRLLKGREIIGFTGELGAGKTRFIQGIARGLGVGKNEYVRSPTFTLINEYKGRIPLYHFDLYRIGGPGELLGLGYEEYFYSDGVSVVEWFEKMQDLKPEEFLHIDIEIGSETQRELHFSCKGVYYKQLLKCYGPLCLKEIKG